MTAIVEILPDLLEQTGIMLRIVALGLLFLGALPSTVQSATAYSSLAGGNVAASVVAASAPGMVTSSWTARPKPPWPLSPMLTSATTSESVMSIEALPATSLSAEWKQAA